MTADLKLDDQQISDAYIYLLGRLLITRQQQADFDDEGLSWNALRRCAPKRLGGRACRCQQVSPSKRAP